MNIGYVVQCFKLMLSKFLNLGFLLFDFFYRENVTCLNHFTGYGHYTGKVEENNSQTSGCFLDRCGKN